MIPARTPGEKEDRLGGEEPDRNPIDRKTLGTEVLIGYQLSWRTTLVKAPSVCVEQAELFIAAKLL